MNSIWDLFKCYTVVNCIFRKRIYYSNHSTTLLRLDVGLPCHTTGKGEARSELKLKGLGLVRCVQLCKGYITSTPINHRPDEVTWIFRLNYIYLQYSQIDSWIISFQLCVHNICIHHINWNFTSYKYLFIGWSIRG